jgi:hypothetical protein
MPHQQQQDRFHHHDAHVLSPTLNCCCTIIACRNGNREIIDLQQGLFGTASTAAADPKAILNRRAHGVLMAINFILILPLGALAARQLRSHWITSPRVRASMFYVHMAAQVRNNMYVSV